MRGFVGRGTSNILRNNKRKAPLICFDDSDYVAKIPNHDEPLMVFAFMANKEMQKLLASSVDTVLSIVQNVENFGIRLTTIRGRSHRVFWTSHHSSQIYQTASNFQ